MIKGKPVKDKVFDIPKVSYRKLDALNQTMIKLFDSDPVRFFEEFKLGKTRKIKKTPSLAIGDMVDFYLLACKGDEEEFHNRFDEKFALYSGNKGSGQVFLLADCLFELTERDTDEETGKVKTSFDTRFTEAVVRLQNDGKYKGKPEAKVLEDFETNGLEYFEMLLQNIGKTVVDTSLVDKALIVANKIKSDPFTRHLFTFPKSDKIEVLTHVPVMWKYQIDKKRSITCKAEIDMVEIDHSNKVITIRDLKTAYDNESFEYAYIKNSYYLQNAFYHEAIAAWAVENDLGDYTIATMSFVVGDTSSNNRRPLVYQTYPKDVEAGMNGFVLRGTKYRGIKELIEEIAWCEEKEMWDCNKESYDKNGQLDLQIKYEKEGNI